MDLQMLNEGAWMATCLDQQIITFFLPLPDVLGVPAGQSFKTFVPLTLQGSKILGRLDAEIAHQSLDDPDPIVVFSTGREVYGPGSEKELVLWNKCTLNSSLSVHHVETDLMRRIGLDAAALAAGVGSGGFFNPGDSVLSTLYSQPTPRLGDASRVTVIEAAVPLRILGNPEDVEVIYGLTSTDEGVEPRYPDAWEFVGPTSPARSEIFKLRAQFSLDIAITDVRTLQKAYRALTGRPATLLTRERLPFIVPTVLRRLEDIGRGHNLAVQTVTETHISVHLYANSKELDRPKIQTLNHARMSADDGPFMSYIDLLREAELHLHRQGDVRLCALLSALAAESLLNELLLHLRWEEAHTPEDASDAWIDGLVSRLKVEFPGRLGGNWSLSGTNAVAQWNRHVVQVRNRVVHGAYEPTRSEAEAAIGAVGDLAAFLSDRLTSQEQLRRYPRTAIVFVGNDRLEKRGVYSKKLRALQDNPDEPPWQPRRRNEITNPSGECFQSTACRSG